MTEARSNTEARSHGDARSAGDGASRRMDRPTPCPQAAWIFKRLVRRASVDPCAGRKGGAAGVLTALPDIGVESRSVRLLCCGPSSSPSRVLAPLDPSSITYLPPRVRAWRPPSRPPTPNRGPRRRPSKHPVLASGRSHITSLAARHLVRRVDHAGPGMTWVPDPVLAFYPSARDARAAPRDCAVSIRTLALRYLLRDGHDR